MAGPAWLPRALPLAALCLVAAVIGFVREFSGDFHWHVVLGRHVLEHGELYARDLHSYSVAGQPMFNSSWLGDVILAACFDGLGYLGVYLWRAVMLIGMSLALVTACARCGLKLAYGAALVAVVLARSAFVFYPRPETMAFALLATLLMVLGQHEESGGRRPLIIALVLLLAWPNLHGSAGIALMVFGVYCASWLVRTWLAGERSVTRLAQPVLLPVLAFLLTCVNPHGIWIPLAFTKMQGQHAALINEYIPLSWSRMDGLTRLALLSVAGTTLAAAPRISSWRLIVFAVLAFLAARYQRFATYALIAAVPLLAANLAIIADRLAGRPAVQRRWRRAGPALAGLLALWAGTELFAGKRLLGEVGAGLDTSARAFPIRACDYLRTTPPGNVLNSFEFGSYLMFCAGPEHRVFIDQRAQSLYSDAFYRRYVAALSSRRELSALLTDHPSDYVFAAYGPLARTVAALPDWALVHFDDKALVYARRDSPVSGTLAREQAIRFLAPAVVAGIPDLPPEHLAGARDELARQRQRCPRCYRTRLAESAVAIASGDLERARRALASVAERDSPEVALVGARLAQWEGDDRAAESAYQHYIELSGDLAAPAVYRARDLARLGRFDEAEAALAPLAADPAFSSTLERARRELAAARSRATRLPSSDEP